MMAPKLAHKYSCLFEDQETIANHGQIWQLYKLDLLTSLTSYVASQGLTQVIIAHEYEKSHNFY